MVPTFVVLIVEANDTEGGKGVGNEGRAEKRGERWKHPPIPTLKRGILPESDTKAELGPSLRCGAGFEVVGAAASAGGTAAAVEGVVSPVFNRLRLGGLFVPLGLKSSCLFGDFGDVEGKCTSSGDCGF